jgi:uncharacterized membrane protein
VTEDSPESGATSPPSPFLGRLRRAPPTVWLALAIGGYFAVSLALSWLRVLEFQTSTWDMGIYQQALWSTAHGRAFYEAADLETGGYRSLLEVHTVFLFYLLAPLYAALPNQVTLLALQSLVVGLAAVPLYFLGKDVSHSARLGLVVAVAYLVWTPVLSANLYDFHAEAFLPIELFTVVLFWERERYAWGAAVAAISFATLELAPVLLFFVGLFFLVPSRATWERWRRTAGDRFPWTAWRSDLRPALSSRRVQASVALLVACIAVYLLLVYYRVDYLNATLGRASVTVVPTGYVIGSSPSALGLSLSNLYVGFYAKVAYWALIFALLGFVPLLAPRALVLSLPWFAFTMLSSNLNYVQLGWQYGFIAAGSMLVAFAYGLPGAVRLWEHGNASRRVPESPAVPSRSPPARRTGARRWRGGVVVVMAVFVGVNVALSPANPLLQNHGLGAAYRISYAPGPGYGDVEQIATLIPAGASVIASDVLFPLIANDANAYSFLWEQDNFLGLPFNASHLPSYVFIASNRTAAVPAWLTEALYNLTLYGIRGVAWTSDVGPALLFESGYAGPPAVYGNNSTLPLRVDGASLVNSAAGYAVASPGTGPTDFAASDPGVLGTFFFGPWASLPGGNYTVTLWVNATHRPGTAPSPASEPAVWIGASAFAQTPFFGWSMELDNFAPVGWTAVEFNVSLPGPTLKFAVQGVVLATNVQAALEAVEIVPR